MPKRSFPAAASGLPSRRTTTAAGKQRSDAELSAHPDPNATPEEYGLVVQGDCMAPEIPDGAVAHIDRREPVRGGDLAAIYFRPEFVKPGQGSVWLKRLVTSIPDWVTFPWTDNPKSEVRPVLIVEMNNPRRQYAVPCSAILAVHRCLGVVLAEPQAIDLPRSRKRKAAGERP